MENAEKHTDRLLTHMFSNGSTSITPPWDDRIFLSQAQTIRELAPAYFSLKRQSSTGIPRRCSARFYLRTTKYPAETLAVGRIAGIDYSFHSDFISPLASSFSCVFDFRSASQDNKIGIMITVDNNSKNFRQVLSLSK